MKKTKTLGQLKKKAQIVFNAAMRKKLSYCISCGGNNNLQAGHFYPVSTHEGLRFDEDNVWPECCRCNCFDEGHLINYADNLPGVIGKERFEALKARAAEYKRNGKKWSRSEIEEIIEKYS